MTLGAQKASATNRRSSPKPVPAYVRVDFPVSPGNLASVRSRSFLRSAESWRTDIAPEYATPTINNVCRFSACDSKRIEASDWSDAKGDITY